MKISDLNKITITDLKNFDWESAKSRLKSFDWESVKDRLISNPTPLVCILIVIITTVAVSKALLRVHKDTEKTKQTEIAKLHEQVKALNGLEATQKQYNDFFTKIPDVISESKLSEILGDAAIARNIQILSSSTPNKKSSVYVNLTSVGITIASESYTDIVRFIHDIENSPYSIHVEKWSGNLIVPFLIRQRFSQQGGQQGTEKTIANKPIEVKVKIGIVEFKND